jgi:hypothetical protein
VFAGAGVLTIDYFEALGSPNGVASFELAIFNAAVFFVQSKLA